MAKTNQAGAASLPGVSRVAGGLPPVRSDQAIRTFVAARFRSVTRYPVSIEKAPARTMADPDIAIGWLWLNCWIFPHGGFAGN